MVADHLIPGAVKQEEVMTFPGCIVACNQSEDCLAIDYDFNKHQCFFHFVTTVCSDLKASPGAFHVRFAKCPMPGKQPFLPFERAPKVSGEAAFGFISKYIFLV